MTKIMETNKKNRRKVWWIRKKLVPLHPQN